MNRRGTRDRRARRDQPFQHYAHGWSDANYYAGPGGSGRGALGTVRLVGYLITLPATAQKIIAAKIAADQTGWRIQTGLDSAATISVIIGGSVTGWATSPRHTFVAGDVGRLFVMHGWCDASGAHLAIGGAEVGAGSGSLITGTDPAGESVTFGRYPHAGGFSNAHIGIVNLSATGTVLSLPQIAADAAAIMARPQRLTLPLMPGEDMRYVASDAIGGPWHDRVGDDCTLAENGTVSVSLVP